MGVASTVTSARTPGSGGRRPAGPGECPGPQPTPRCSSSWTRTPCYVRARYQHEQELGRPQPGRPNSRPDGRIHLGAGQFSSKYVSAARPGEPHVARRTPAPATTPDWHRLRLLVRRARSCADTATPSADATPRCRDRNTLGWHTTEYPEGVLMPFEERFLPTGSEDPANRLANGESRSANREQVTVATQPDRDLAEGNVRLIPGRCACGTNTSAGPRPASM